MDVLKRFWSKVDVKEKDECWNWISPSKSGNGYGRFRYYPNGTPMQAHRVSWILTHGDIPGKLLVLHKCDNKLCVNPNHLYLGNHSANNYDRMRKNPIYK